ncbi:Nucleic-acid-binding protein from transposon X-element [Eumeta japonica]|uniref:Nucleic-acid-binding protein from transposon X-element n=1 Tax=Eumeta variegata TaxID=151549 RepID=A0A4C2A5V8_EUMVA|nr:Nucleic-acid-binding protein from transposon X-element [Eumeta japonica]
MHQVYHRRLFLIWKNASTVDAQRGSARRSASWLTNEPHTPVLRGCARFDTIERISSSCVSTDHALHQDSDHYSDLSPDASPGLVLFPKSIADSTFDFASHRVCNSDSSIGHSSDPDVVRVTGIEMKFEWHQRKVPLAPRSPSLEPYAESTDSTTYAALTLEAGVWGENYFSPPSTPSPKRLYAAVAASSPHLIKNSSQNSIRTTTPGPARVISEANADIIPDINTAAPPNTAANTGETTHKARGYPPIVVENLPNWVAHFEELRRLIGHAPNARPFGKGIRFLPKSDTEFRTVQRYLQAAARRDHQVTWNCYALEAERPSKVGIRGLPVDTAPDTIVSALQELDFPAEYVRPIPPRKGRPGCLFYARLGLMNQGQLQSLYGVNTLLNMPGITIEGWRGREGPPQCHRCQTFGHSSVNCHRPQRCVRRGEGHIAADCTRPRDQGPTCANCQGPHPASDRRCPVFRKVARQRGSKIPPIPLSQTPPPEHQHQQQCRDPMEEAGRRSGAPTIGLPTLAAVPTVTSVTPGLPMTELPHTSTTERALVEVEPTVEGRRRRRRRKVRFPLLPSPPEELADHPRVQSSRAASEAATAMRAVWPRSMPIREARSAMFPPPPIARPRVVPQREMPPTILTSKRTPVLPINQISQPLIRTDPNTWLLEQLTEILRTIIAGQDPIQTTQDLRTLVQSQDIYVVLLGETKLRSRQELRLPNFFVYRRDEVSPHGIAYRGTAVLVRRDVFHGGLELPDFINTRTLGIRVGAAGTELRLFAAYRPPVTRFCSSDIRTIFEDHTPTILAGDLNAKHTVWDSRVVSPAGRQLLQDAEDYGYEVLGPDTPSHVPTGPRFGADVLDVVLCHRLPFPIHVEVLYSADTQHLPILITLSTTAHLTPARPQTHRTNWSAYQHALEELHIGKSFSSPSPVRQVSTMKSRARIPRRPHIFRQRLAADGTFLYACSARSNTNGTCKDCGLGRAAHVSSVI